MRKKKGLVCVVDVLDVKGEGVSRQCVCVCVYLKRTISWGKLRRIQNEPSLNKKKCNQLLFSLFVTHGTGRVTISVYDHSELTGSCEIR